ncbi:hypothetical protein [Streptomyces sp. NPDC056682]|uniref:hypothetical protein n=1 Tax=Streptomyces sp. NPDC056682 TaxID=3345909 RepID=UPI0036A24FAE
MTVGTGPRSSWGGCNRCAPATEHDLEAQWHRGEEVATEDLRVALQQYRSFFNRLLST